MLRIVHLSDIHFLNNHADGNARSTEALIEDLMGAHSQKPIDLLIISGDLIDKGGNGDPITNFLSFEEQFLLPIISKLGLSKECCIFAPGNHDMVRENDSTINENGIKATLTSEQVITKHMETFQTDGVCRTKEFKDFEREFHKKSSSKVDIDTYASNYRVVRKGISVGITCFNSAWRSFDSAADQGNMILGQSKVLESIRAINDCTVKIGVSHHPLDWLIQFDKEACENLIKKEYDMLLCGHTHQGTSYGQTSMYGHIFVSVAPSNWDYNMPSDSRNSSNGYAIIDYNCDHLVVKNRRYHFTKNKFDPNPDLGDENGEVIHKFVPHGELEKLSVENDFSNRIRNEYLPVIPEHLLTYQSESCAPQNLQDLFVSPRLINKVIHSIESGTEEKNVSIDEILRSKNNYIVFGPKESGKTILLDKLIIEFHSQIDTSRVIPIRIDFKRIGNRVETEIAAFLNVSIINIPRVLKEHKFVLLIEDIVFSDMHSYDIQKIEKFHGDYKDTVRIIGTCTQRTEGEIPVEFIKNAPKIENLVILHIGSFRSKEIKTLIHKWFIKKTQTSINAETLIKSFLSLNLPRTPLAISMFLWIFESQEAIYAPTNNADMLENYIERLFKKQLTHKVLRAEFTFRNAERLLSAIAYEMLKGEAENYCLQYSQVLAFTEKYFALKGFSFVAETELEKLIKTGILVKEEMGTGHCLKFRFNCFFQYYLTKQMNFDKQFLDEVLSEEKYLNFIDEIDYYTGLKRDCADILNLLLERMHNKYLPLVGNIQQLPQTFDQPFIFFNKSEEEQNVDQSPSIERLLEINKPTNDEIDEMNDEMNDEMLDTHSIETTVKQKNPNITQLELLDRVWQLTSKVLKNSEEISDPILKANALKMIIVCGMSFAGMYKVFLEARLAEKADSMIPQMKDTMTALINFLPFIYESVQHTFVGTGKLASVLKEKIDKDLTDEEISDFEKFTSVFLYADLMEQDATKYIANLAKNVRYPYVYRMIILKLFSYYLFGKSSKEKDLEYKNLMAEVNLKLTKRSKKEEKSHLIQKFERIKNKELKRAGQT